jgi:glycosyltransferase involved in cell wall biosynthesis
LHPAKGHEDLLNALALLRSQHPALLFCCLFIGEGELREPLQAQVQALGLQGTVVFAGLRRDVPRLLAALDVMVMPSRWEGLPMALLEAMACARAVVATRVGGIPDVVVDGEHGLLVSPQDPPALAQALARVIEAPALRQQLGHAAREVVLQRFDAQRTSGAYEALYAQALGLESTPFSPTGS